MVGWPFLSELFTKDKCTMLGHTVSSKMENMDARITKNADNINGCLKRVERKVEEMQEKMEDILFEELRERVQERKERKLNFVIHGVEEPAENVQDNRERGEEDNDACGRIFRSSNLIIVLKKVTEAKDTGKSVDVIYLDFSKAF
jgi:hypothetical protein